MYPSVHQTHRDFRKANAVFHVRLVLEDVGKTKIQRTFKNNLLKKSVSAGINGWRIGHVDGCVDTYNASERSEDDASYEAQRKQQVCGTKQQRFLLLHLHLQTTSNPSVSSSISTSVET